jgi:hypothetical protein
VLCSPNEQSKQYWSPEPGLRNERRASKYRAIREEKMKKQFTVIAAIVVGGCLSVQAQQL